MLYQLNGKVYYDFKQTSYAFEIPNKSIIWVMVDMIQSTLEFIINDKKRGFVYNNN